MQKFRVFVVAVCAVLSEGLHVDLPEQTVFNSTLDTFYEDGPAVQDGYRMRLYGSPYGEGIRQCLAGKRVLILGNSVSRHWFYALRDILNASEGSKRSRADEIRECGRGGQYEGSRPGQGPCYGLCGCSVEVGHNTTLVFLWQQRVYDPKESGVLHECADVVMINTGGDDIFDRKRRSAFKDILERELPQLRDTLRDVIASCPQTKLYWRTTTPVCGPRYGTSELGLNEMIKYSNQRFTAMLRKAKVAWVYDAWAKNANRCKDYDDTIHHSKLVEEHVHDVLAHHCAISRQ